jgi:hypothetical protein
MAGCSQLGSGNPNFKYILEAYKARMSKDAIMIAVDAGHSMDEKFS